MLTRNKISFACGHEERNHGSVCEPTVSTMVPTDGNHEVGFETSTLGEGSAYM
jgi:hypothetical protein